MTKIHHYQCDTDILYSYKFGDMGTIELQSSQPIDDKRPTESTSSLKRNAIALSSKLNEIPRSTSHNKTTTIPGFEFERNIKLKATAQDVVVETNKNYVISDSASQGAISKGLNFGWRDPLKDGDAVGRSRNILHSRQTHFHGKLFYEAFILQLCTLKL